jgi:hypothetical protein
LTGRCHRLSGQATPVLAEFGFAGLLTPGERGGPRPCFVAHNFAFSRTPKVSQRRASTRPGASGCCRALTHHLCSHSSHRLDW